MTHYILIVYSINLRYARYHAYIQMNNTFRGALKDISNENDGPSDNCVIQKFAIHLLCGLLFSVFQHL